MTANDASLAQGDAPIFLLGNPRSGTTFLRIALTTHSQIGIPPETDFMVRLFPYYGAIKAFDRARLDAFKADLAGSELDLAARWKVEVSALFEGDDELIGQPYAAVCAHVYRRFQVARGIGAKTVWGDKNNSYRNYIPILKFLYPKARFIHLVRDGRAVLNSYRNLNGPVKHRFAPRLPNAPREAGLMWRDTVGRIERHLADLPQNQHFTLHYEDLMADFKGEIEQLCVFLELPFETRILEFHEENRRYELEPRELWWKENTFKPIDPTKAHSWKQELTPKMIEEFENVAGQTLSKLDYTLETGPAAKEISAPVIFFALKARLREWLRHARYLAVRARIWR